MNNDSYFEIVKATNDSESFAGSAWSFREAVSIADELRDYLKEDEYIEVYEYVFKGSVYSTGK